MLKIRVIPTLLLRNQGLVKTRSFKDAKYVGDPINAVKIFNEKEVDELIFLDIMATNEKRGPNFKVIADIASECFMPFAYGGGIRDLDDINTLFMIGAEKVVVNSFASECPQFIRNAAEKFGSQSIVVSIDVRRNVFGKYTVYTAGGRIRSKYDPITLGKIMEDMGAGEIILTSIEREGTMKGYDINLIQGVASSLSIPVVANGGAGTVQDFRDAVREGGASAVSAGSMFVFQGKHRAVLISYPSKEDVDSINEP